MTNLLKKYTERLQTYTELVDYFDRNPAKIPTHISRLEDLQRELLKPLDEDIAVSDEDIQDKVRVICMKKEQYTKLSDRLSKIIQNNVNEKLHITNPEIRN